MPGKPRAAASGVEIKSDYELDAAIREVCGLFHSAQPLSTRQERRVQKLSEAIEQYEDEHHAMPEPTDAGLLSHLMDARRVGARTVSRQTKIPVATIEAILNGTRRIGRTEAGALSAYFCVEPDTFSSDLEPLMFFGFVARAGIVASIIGRFRVALSSAAKTKGDMFGDALTYRPWTQQGGSQSAPAEQ